MNSKYLFPPLERIVHPYLEYISWLGCNNLKTFIYADEFYTESRDDHFCSSNTKHLSVENYYATEAQKQARNKVLQCVWGSVLSSGFQY